MTDDDRTGQQAGTTDEPTDTRDGVRRVRVPTEDSNGECYHVRGGCGGHHLTSIEATAKELLSVRGLYPCGAKGCVTHGIDEPRRCNGCGKPVFESDPRAAEHATYCAMCADYLEANPDSQSHEQYKLREGDVNDPVLRRDVRESARRVLDRECPEDDCGGETHVLCGQHPALATSKAWGAYLNPVYRCRACDVAHVLLTYETPRERDRPAWGTLPDDKRTAPPKAREFVNERVLSKLDGDGERA